MLLLLFHHKPKSYKELKQPWRKSTMVFYLAMKKQKHTLPNLAFCSKCFHILIQAELQCIFQNCLQGTSCESSATIIMAMEWSIIITTQPNPHRENYTFLYNFKSSYIKVNVKENLVIIMLMHKFILMGKWIIIDIKKRCTFKIKQLANTLKPQQIWVKNSCWLAPTLSRHLESVIQC